ncbi:hypothetical protein [Acidianus sp. HS-5]|uniref:hypothetical protein n=1 Tax=Acidianus sp. HS-5 TaxID=2886040 RepID=UPI001F1E05F7|nr:hypothetical protein [Acidianus sp. HS-5]BDC18011.1 hypothetical protein HS5_09010 [Acidianus sp. HS-5]
MKRVLRIPRFTKDGKPKTLELLVDSASINDKGFAQEAKFLLVIGDGNNRVAFQLSTAEASLLYHRLRYALDEASKEYIEMEEKSKKNYVEKKSGGSKKSEEEDFSDLMDEE